MDTIINNADFMTIKNLKLLIKIFNKFLIDTHGINIESENINIKQILFELMTSVFNTKYGKELNLKELNKITLKLTRDNIYQNNKDIFTNQKKFGTIHRENQIHNNRTSYKNVDFKDKKNLELKKEIAVDINNNLNKLQNQRNNNTNNIPTQVEFEEKMKYTELTLEDMGLKMKALEDSRNKQNTDIITNMKNNNELVTNDNLVPSQQINNTNMEPINFNRIPEENERNNLLDNMNNHINDNLNNNTLDGFNLDDNFNDFSLDLTNNTNNNQNYVIDNNQNVINLQEQMIQSQQQQLQEQPQERLQQQLQEQPQEQLQQHLQEQPQEQLQQQLQEQPQEQMIHQTILKKIIICSKDRDMEEFPLPNKYKITLEQPMRYIKRIKLVNILINFKKERKKKNIDKSEDEIENFNYAILNLNNYDVNKSNNSKINNSFAFIYPNKVYDEEIFFENELDVLEEINIEILNEVGDLLKIKDNHIIELQLEVF